MLTLSFNKLPGQVIKDEDIDKLSCQALGLLVKLIPTGRDQFEFDYLSSISGFGRRTLRAVLKELQTCGYAKLQVILKDTGGYGGTVWEVKGVDRKGIKEEEHAVLSGQIMEMLSTDGYPIKYRTSGELEYKEGVWKTIRKSKEFKRLLGELSCDRDVFLDRYLDYCFEENVPMYLNRLEGVLRSHDKYMKMEAQTPAGRARQTSAEEYDEMIRSVIDHAKKFIPNYAQRMRPEEEREAIRVILHRTELTPDDLRLFHFCGWHHWDVPFGIFLWSTYVTRDGFLYQELMRRLKTWWEEDFKWYKNAVIQEEWSKELKWRTANFKSLWKALIPKEREESLDRIFNKIA